MALSLGLIPLALLGALLGLDVVSFPQAMISRPLVAATLGGAQALWRDDLGRLTPGSRADAAVLSAPSYTHIVYRPGVPLVAATIRAGQLEWLDPEGGLV